MEKGNKGRITTKRHFESTCCSKILCGEKQEIPKASNSRAAELSEFQLYLLELMHSFDLCYFSSKLAA